MSLPEAINSVVNLTLDRGVAVVCVNSPPVNALSLQVREGLAKAINEVSASDAAAMVLICEGRTFIAGADIAELEAPLQGILLPELVARLEAMVIPVVAALHGTALGGGLEVALGAHYRIAVPSAQMGLPEVHLGLLPGAGGTQRLPRLIGVENALDLITSGRQVKAQEAMDLGLIDAIVDEGSLQESAVDFARQAAASREGSLRRTSELEDWLVQARGNPALFDEFRKANARKFRGFDAPEAIVASIEAALTSISFEEGIAEEARLFQKLLNGKQSAAQRHYFFAERAASKIPGLPSSAEPRTIRKVGIVGAGTMGGGIAMNFANIGMPVILVEVQPVALERGLSTIRNNYERSAKRRGEGGDYVDSKMAHISGSLDLTDLEDCDLVIEAAFERLDIKLNIFTRLDAICRSGAILASNTSALDLNKIASATSRPQDVIGLHFFSPANVMRLLEVVRGEKTAEDVVATAMQLARKIGKVAVLSGVCDGFIGNRMLFKRQDQAMQLLLEGALPWEIDRVLTEFGFPMGPFAMEDLAGLDIGWDEAGSSGRSLKEVMCEAGRRGQKAGAGYYDYDDARRAVPSQITENLIRSFAASNGTIQRTIGDQEILERCLFPMINEGAKILDEGIALRASDIDVVWVNGYGWPVYRGGPMFYADQLGLKTVIEGLFRYEVAGLSGFEAAPLLETLAIENRKFSNFQTSAV